MAAGHNFGSLAALRILLGAFEAAINPGFTMITSMFYKPSEHALRHGLWYSGASIAYIFGGIISYGISHINSGIATWKVPDTLNLQDDVLITLGPFLGFRKHYLRLGRRDVLASSRQSSDSEVLD